MDRIRLHYNPVLHFSGGKDSLAALFLLREYWDVLHVMWVNTGAAHPETLAQMAELKALIPKFIEVRSDQPADLALHGYPTDLLPAANTVIGAGTRQTEGPLLQTWVDCCSRNLWAPLQNATRALGSTLVVRGTKDADYRSTPLRSGHVENGVEYYLPLQDWTDADVMTFLGEQGVEIPSFYQHSETSLDCWNCTAFIEERETEIKNMKLSNPALWAEYQPLLESVINAARDEYLRLNRVREVVNGRIC